MKYVEGETLESIIEKLAGQDPSYQREYTFERRAEIFGALLHALAYAHANGVVHRDVKPANVMVGRYGEVMLMDWGVAKPVASERDLAAGAEATVGEQDGGEGGERSRLYATRIGALVGTPAYMAPEQARGENDRIDARSDLYAAAVLLYELLTTHHYLEGKTTVEAMIMAVIRDELSYRKMFELLDPAQPRPPAELMYLAADGMAKDPAKRFQSADEMLGALQRIAEGRMHVHCYVTLMKRFLREAARFVDRHAGLALVVVLLVATLSVLGAVLLARLAMG
jgi:serine/threonine protein kinase